MKKVLVLGNNDLGLYKFRKELLKELVNTGYEVHFSVPDGPYIEKLEETGAVFQQLNFDNSSKSPVKELGLVLRYNKLLKQLKPNIVLMYTLKPSLYGGLHCKKLKIPYIINITGLSPIFVEEKLLGKVILKMYKGILNQAQMVFFQNRAQFELFKKRGMGKNCELIPGSGVNLNENKYELYEVYDKIRILFVGRVLKSKGIEDLLDAIEIIKDNRDDVEFRVVGGCDNEYLERLERMQSEKKLIYYGLQDNVHHYIKECNALILPSYSEGMANVLLEAAACGRPVLASNIPGCQETFVEGKTGFGFDKGNVDSIVTSLLKFCSLSDIVREEMGKSGRDHVDKLFSRTIIVNKYKNEIAKEEKNEFI